MLYKPLRFNLIKNYIKLFPFVHLSKRRESSANALWNNQQWSSSVAVENYIKTKQKVARVVLHNNKLKHCKPLLLNYGITSFNFSNNKRQLIIKKVNSSTEFNVLSMRLDAQWKIALCEPYFKQRSWGEGS